MFTDNIITEEVPLIDTSTIQKAKKRPRILHEIEKQVIIHCSLYINRENLRIRLWPSTFLYDRGSSHCVQLVHSEGIAVYPEVMPVENSSVVNFTLIFPGLRKHCKSFDMVERTPFDTLPFEVKAIKRNDTDVYHVKLFY